MGTFFECIHAVVTALHKNQIGMTLFKATYSKLDQPAIWKLNPFTDFLNITPLFAMGYISEV